MDMQVFAPPRVEDVQLGTPAAEYVRLAEQRERVFALIGRFRRALAQPGGIGEAIGALQAILPCSRAYFAAIESLVDKITASGAEPHREQHRRVLSEMKQALDRCVRPGATPKAADLAHALDALVLHEATIRLRHAPDWGSPT
jgi:hypothetical protein